MQSYRLRDFPVHTNHSRAYLIVEPLNTTEDLLKDIGISRQHNIHKGHRYDEESHGILSRMTYGLDGSRLRAQCQVLLNVCFVQ